MTAYLSVHHHLLLCTHLHRTPSPVLTDRYDINFRNEHVQYHTDRFIRLFELSNEPWERILLEDDLRATYLKSYNDGMVQVEVSMENTY